LYRLHIEYINRGIDPQIRLFWAVPGIDYVAQAIVAAKKAEVVVMAMGLSPNLEGEEMPVQVPGFAGGDRTDISLPGPQEALLKQIHALGKPVALALLNGSALAINWAAAHVPAIIEAWYPGQAGGQALADVLFGDYNPAGRLPVTFYQSVDDLPPFDDYRMAGHTYRYFEGQPLFSFGYGLSYTTFAYNNLRLSSQTIDAAETLTVSVDVTNTGARSGDEVVQLYVRDVEASVARPFKDLKGFQRIGLEAGETKTVTFILAAHQLGFYNKNQAIVVEPGEFEIMVGGSSDGIHLRGNVEVAYFTGAES
jgi:beta-glucosidase